MPVKDTVEELSEKEMEMRAEAESGTCFKEKRMGNGVECCDEASKIRMEQGSL